MTGLAPGAAALAFLLAAVAPLALALAAGEEPGGWHEEAGIAAGLVGLALLLLQFAHAGRWEAVSGRVGIDVTMRFHRAAAILLLALVLLHPVLFVAPLLARDPLAGLARLHAMFGSPRMTTGKLAWIALIVTVALALARRRMRYQVWRLLHGLGAAAAAGLAVWHALSVGLYSGFPILALMWLAGLAGAGLLLGWSWGWKPWRLGGGRWRLGAVAPLGSGYWEVTLDGPAPHHRAGQFFWLAFGRTAPWDDNPFSVASAPGEKRLRFVIREAGDMTRRLGSLGAGLPVRVDGPYGAFVVPDGDGPLLLVAGGAGIAPILSIARDLAARGDPRPVALLHGARSADRLVCRAEVAAIAARHGWRVLHLAEEGEIPPPVETGLMQRDRLAALISGWNPAEVTAMICGPEPMTMAVVRHLEALGVPPGGLRYELFDYA
ncbi:ferric reductase-like transmembrane domain-containing protein [Falsiroseomonas sp.]|uniref:ferredoxin reductase family protein n=1 Tax=Falsiroseomonas sp. TaxID=2870721 RepID=UPI0035616466